MFLHWFVEGFVNFPRIFPQVEILLFTIVFFITNYVFLFCPIFSLKLDFLIMQKKPSEVGGLNEGEVYLNFYEPLCF